VSRRVLAAAAPAVAALAFVAACRRPSGGPPPFTASLTLGGRTVAPAVLERGRDTYTHFCRPCHGDAGDGKGPAASGVRPPPRDLRLGVYKFAAVPAGQLPRDEDFVRTIKHGLHGTAMLAWDVPDAALDDLIQYVKAFAPRWRSEAPGDAVVPGPDPWTGRDDDGIERGKRVYHGLAQCAVACHAAYVTKAEIYAFAKELTGADTREIRGDVYLPIPKDSDYGFKILPPDFTFNPLRGGDTLDDIYRAIASGVGGTAMPTWKGVLPDADLWALARYVRSLASLRDTPRAEELRRALAEQPPWSPPPLDGGSDGAARD
jgi:mono/diheme cytochrome c family protein